MSNTDTLNFEGDAGSLFSIADDLTGSVFTVGDISGIPIIDVNGDTHNVTIAQFDGKVMIGGTDSGSTDSDVLNVTGNVRGTVFSGSGASLTNLNASNISSGTVADARLPASISSDITGNAATATALETARNIGGVSFDGTGNIDLPGVNSAGNQNTSGTAAIATSITATANNTNNESVFITFVDGASGTQGIETDTGLTYNPNTQILTLGTDGGDNVTFDDGGIITAGNTNSLTLMSSGNSVVLKHAGDNIKLQTASYGVQITGTAGATTFSGSGASLTSIPAGELTGTIADARIPNLAASKITSGLFDSARLQPLAMNASYITTGTLDANRINNVAASAISSGRVDSDRLPIGVSFHGVASGGAAGSVAADDIATGDAAVTLTTTTGNITIDAQANDTDIIFKGTDNNNDTTFLTIDGSDAGKLVLNNGLKGAAMPIASTGGNIDLSAVGGAVTITGDTGTTSVNGNGGVDIKHGGSTKIETTSGGASVTGTLTVSSDVTFDSAGAVFFDESLQQLGFGDNFRAKFGASGDLQIYHDGSHSRISEVGTGDFILNSTSGDLIFRTNTSENSIIANNNGAVELYHDNSKKFETASGGVTVTGTVDATAFDGDGSALANLNATKLASGTVPSARLSLSASDIPNLAASKITSGLLDSARLQPLAMNASYITTGTIASARLSLSASDIPNLAASKITSGLLDSARLQPLAMNASYITTGTISDDRLPASISSDITGNAATATALETARNIGGVSFDGTGNIDLPGVNSAGNQNTSGTAAIATTVTVADESTDTTCFPLFATAASGNLEPKSGSNLTFNSSSGLLTATSFSGSAASLSQIPMGEASGTLAAARVGELPASKITSGLFDSARLPLGVSFHSAGGGSGNGIDETNGIFLEYQKRVTSSYNVDNGVTALTACNDSDGIEIVTGVTVTISDSSGWVITGGDKNMGLDAMVATSNQTERTMRTGTIKPTLNNTYDLGDSAVAWRNIYTNDLNLSNETGGGNDVDGTTGKWTIQEGEENLYIINRKTGKKYKFMLEEIV